jgi:hypothetical protein
MTAHSRLLELADGFVNRFAKVTGISGAVTLCIFLDKPPFRKSSHVIYMRCYE